MVKKIIFFTGGGSGGHTIPALTLIKEIKIKAPEVVIHYIGSRKGLEKKIMSPQVLYHSIFTGKLRRYFSLRHVTDLISFCWGIMQSVFILSPYAYKGYLLFSTGGFVSLGPVLVARLLGYEVFLHEQTSRVGLANKIASRFCHRIYISFHSSKIFFPSSKTYYSGYPLRREIELEPSKPGKFHNLDLSKLKKPIILITGGGNGSWLINKWVNKYKKELWQEYTLFHQVGKNYIDQYAQEKPSIEHYNVFDFSTDLLNLMKHSSLIISRSGAGIVSEIIYLNIPAVFIPLKIAQHNEQYHNAMEAKKLIQADIIVEDAFLQSPHIDTIKKQIQLGQNRRANKKLAKTSNTGRDFLIKEILKKANN